MAIVCRLWARTMDAIHQQLADFQLDACVCFCEEDRPLVYSNIACLMQAINAADADAAYIEALGAFNKQVRQHLPGALTASVGLVGWNHSHVIALSLFTTVAYSMSDPPSHVLRRSTIHAVRNSIWLFAQYPLSIS